MSHNLDARQHQELRSSLKARARQLREEIHQTLAKSDEDLLLAVLYPMQAKDLLSKRTKA